MNDQLIIDWQTRQLEQGLKEPMPEVMQAYLQTRPALQQELAFMASFWQHVPVDIPEPSAQLSANFYQMLDEAKLIHTSSPEVQALNRPAPTHGQQPSRVLSWLSGWLAPNPVAQFASLALVFAMGMGVNQYSGNRLQNDSGLTALQQEVSSLSSLVAISMLQKPSASERLTGVAYSGQTDLSDPVLSKTLIDLLENDKSTAVRLAIVNTLSDSNSLSGIEPKLIDLAVHETNPLVQMELCRLLLINGTSETQRTLLDNLKSITLHEDVAEFINEIHATSRA